MCGKDALIRQGRAMDGRVILIAYLRAKREYSLPFWAIIFLVYDDPTDCVINREGLPDKNGSVRESDTPRDFSGVGFPVRTCTGRRSRCGNVETRVWCWFQSSVGRATTLRKDSAAGPRERHFSTANPAILPISCKCLRRTDAKDENPCLQKAV
jgi:hypothetical protein